MFDLFAGILLLIVLLPLIAVLALVIRLAMGPPVLFRQLRPGLHGKTFCLYKFRTMDNTKDQHGKLLPDEARLTPLGRRLRRWSLDELPQLINVVRGDLSLVGPRPLLVEYLPLYSREQARRHDVRPGITGWAQVNGRNAITWEDKFSLDIWYVDNRSFWLDLKILWMTILRVLRSEGINHQGTATMPEFRGTSGHGDGKGLPFE